jgi:hypothetical protein
LHVPRVVVFKIKRHGACLTNWGGGSSRAFHGKVWFSNNIYSCQEWFAEVSPTSELTSFVLFAGACPLHRSWDHTKAPASLPPLLTELDPELLRVQLLLCNWPWPAFSLCCGQARFDPVSEGGFVNRLLCCSALSLFGAGLHRQFHSLQQGRAIRWSMLACSWLPTCCICSSASVAAAALCASKALCVESSCTCRECKPYAQGLVCSCSAPPAGPPGGPRLNLH